MPKFSGQHYNAIAKDIRTEFPMSDHEGAGHGIYMNNVMRGVLSSLALRLAKRFKADNPNFDPLAFLDACSPNTDLYPLSELWED